VKDFVLRGPDRIVVDVSKGAPPAPAAVPGRPVVVVLDAGHGGKDTGIVTSRGQEKSFTLDLAFAVKKILQKDQRLKVILIRDRDSSFSLDERAAAANSAGAGLFVGIHAASGAADAVLICDSEEEPAAQPSRASGRDFLGFETESEQQEKIWGRQQAVHAKESAALGRTLARRLSANGNAEPLQAPLAGLKAINCPAALVEAGIEADRAKTAENLAEAIEQYVGQNR
jgi:N-acetylmuramoyl-L-alanine amidase